MCERNPASQDLPTVECAFWSSPCQTLVWIWRGCHPDLELRQTNPDCNALLRNCRQPMFFSQSASCKCLQLIWRPSVQGGSQSRLAEEASVVKEEGGELWNGQFHGSQCQPCGVALASQPGQDQPSKPSQNPPPHT